MKEHKIIIEGKPFTVNAQYTQRRGSSKRILTNEARSYGDSVGWQAKSQWKGKPLTGDIEVSFYYYFGQKGKKDHLNFNKILCDRMNQIIWLDDRQIIISHHYTLVDAENPRIELVIKEL